MTTGRRGRGIGTSSSIPVRFPGRRWCGCPQGDRWHFPVLLSNAEVEARTILLTDPAEDVAITSCLTRGLRLRHVSRTMAAGGQASE